MARQATQQHDPDESMEGRELAKLEADQSVVQLLDRGQLDTALTTAHKFPRSIQRFRNEVLALSTLNEETAAECFYTLERKDRDGKKKLIVGPSARFAEILGSSWGNARAGARVVDDRGGFVVAQGVFFDLEKNWTVTYEVQRRITSREGRRYSEDMIAVTANAACAIAIRNAVLKGVPKALWADLWDKTRDVALGKEKSHEDRRARVFAKLAERGITEAVALKRLEKESLADVTPDDLLVIYGLMSKVKDGEQTIQEAFSTDDDDEPTNAAGIESINKETRAAAGKQSPPTSPKQTPAAAASGGPTEIEVAAKINTATTEAKVVEAEDLARSFPDPIKTQLLDLAKARRIEIGKK